MNDNDISNQHIDSPNNKSIADTVVSESVCSINLEII